MTENKELQKRIMKRVTRTYYLKRVFNPLLFKVYGLVAVGAGVASVVSVRNVVANMPDLLDVNGLYTFAQSALLNTEFSVQLALIVAALLSALLIRDTLAKTPTLARVARA